jgi:signal peptidase II
LFKSKSYVIPSFVTILLVLIIDQWLKLWIKSSFPIQDQIDDFGFMELLFIENKGMAFGWELGGNWGKLILSTFRVFAIIGIGFVIRNLIANKAHKGLLITVSLVFAGALGNLLDSAFYGLFFTASDFGTTAEFMSADGGYAPFMMGKVVDMLHFTVTWPEWMPFGFGGYEVFPPIFNVADMAVSGGVIAMLVFNKTFFGTGKGDFSVFKRNYGKGKDAEEAEIETETTAEMNA